MLFKRRSKAEINLLELIPERLFAHSVKDDGLVVVDMPRFHVAWMQKYLVPRAKYPFIKISLDRFGSDVWLRIDGHSDVSGIAAGLKESFGQEVEPVLERIAVFMRQLERRGFIRFRTREGGTV